MRWNICDETCFSSHRHIHSSIICGHCTLSARLPFEPYMSAGSVLVFEKRGKSSGGNIPVFLHTWRNDGRKRPIQQTNKCIQCLWILRCILRIHLHDLELLNTFYMARYRKFYSDKHVEISKYTLAWKMKYWLRFYMHQTGANRHVFDKWYCPEGYIPNNCHPLVHHKTLQNSKFGREFMSSCNFDVIFATT